MSRLKRVFHYNVELDGVSIIETELELSESDVLVIDNHFEKNIYRVLGIHDSKLRLRIVKFIEPCSSMKVEYMYKNEIVGFSNKLSKNQSVFVNDELFVVDNVIKKTNELSMTLVGTVEANAVYNVYEADSKMLIASFKNWGEAYGCIMKNRSEGIKSSF